MSSPDQPFSDRASAFWRHHRLPVEQRAGIAGQGQLGLELRNAIVRGTGPSASTLGVPSPPQQGRIRCRVERAASRGAGPPARRQVSLAR